LNLAAADFGVGDHGVGGAEVDADLVLRGGFHTWFAVRNTLQL
jgi:hypothetical protein